MRLPLIFSAVSLALAPVAAFAQSVPEPEFSAARVKADVEFLASDELEGRNAGTRGYDVAARFVATRFEALGLTPGGTDGGWYQNVPFVTVSFDPANPSSVTIGETNFANGEDVLMGPGSRVDETQQLTNGDAVFVQYGLVSEEHGIDHFAGVDVRGKIVVMLVGAPAGLPPAAMQALAQFDRVGAAEERGAAGVLMVLPPQILTQFPWEEAKHYFMGEQLNWVDPDGNVGGEPARPIRFTAYLKDETKAAEALKYINEHRDAVTKEKLAYEKL